MKKNSNKELAFIDANFFIYLNCISDDMQRKPYEDFYVKIITSYKLSTDILVLDELIYISKKKYGVPYDLTIDFIKRAILPYVNILPINANILDEFLSTLELYSLKPSDAIHVAVMKMNNISVIVSEDDEFDKIPWIKRIWIQKY